MGHLKRTLRTTGISLTVAGMGVVGAAGAASAHGAAGGRDAWGTVTAVGAGSVTITTHQGTTETIDTTTATTYAEIGTLVAPTAAVQGQDVVARLDPADATPTAAEITVMLDRVSGKVTDVTATSITLSGPRSSTREVLISPSTTYYDGKTTATGVTVGEFVLAFGTLDTTTPSALDALFVDVGSTTVCPPRSPRITPSGTVPPNPTDPSTGTWGTHTPAPTPSVTSSAGSAPKGSTPPFSHGPTPQTTGAAGPAASGQGGHGFSGGPGDGGQGSHNFSGGAGAPGGRGGRG
jgi:hypothetical protein